MELRRNYLHSVHPILLFFPYIFSLTGCFPFWHDNPGELYKKIIAGVYRWPDKPAVSDAAKDLVSRLLEKDPKKRLTASECLRHPWVMVFFPASLVLT